MTSPIRGLRVGESCVHRPPGPKSDLTTRSRKERRWRFPGPFTRTAGATPARRHPGPLGRLAPPPWRRIRPRPRTRGAAAGRLDRQLQVEAGVGPGSLADAIFAYAVAPASAPMPRRDAPGPARERRRGLHPVRHATCSPGNLAKVMLAVQVQGGDPTSFGGRDLEADLRATLVIGGADDGRFGAASIADQSLAILALSRTAGGVPATAVDWLVGAQCPSASTRGTARAPRVPARRIPTPRRSRSRPCWPRATARGAAVDLAPGGPASGRSLPSFGPPNTNSSGVGGQALRAAGETAAADAAATFVLTLAVGCDGAAADIGAIEWAVGIPGFLVFSTPQAVLALGAPPLNELSAAGAVPEAPVLECATAPVETPAPAPTTEPAATPPAGGSCPTRRPLPARRCRSQCSSAAPPWWPWPSRPGKRRSHAPRAGAAERTDRAAPAVTGRAGVALALALGVIGAVPRPTSAWSSGACPGSTGVTVIVDFTAAGGDVETRCAPALPRTGLDALAAAGFAVTPVTTQPAFVCRIDGLPGPDDETCSTTPPATAYWSYWTAPRGGAWRYSPVGAAASRPVAGTVEGWSFVTGNTPKPPSVAPPPIAPATPAPTPANAGADAGPDGDPRGPRDRRTHRPSGDDSRRPRRQRPRFRQRPPPRRHRPATREAPYRRHRAARPRRP